MSVEPPPPKRVADSEPRSHTGHATLILLLGLASLALPFVGPVAWWMANQTLAAMGKHAHLRTQRNLVVAGRILGIIGTTLLLAVVTIWVIALSTSS